MGLRCQGVGKAFPGRGGPVVALEGVTFRVGEGEFVCVVGPSGCGKTTLLRLIAGLEGATSGTIAFDGPAPEDRPRCGLVFQEHGLFPWMTVLDNVAFALEARGAGRTDRRRRAREVVEGVGLGAFAGSYPHELSVGMRARVGLARALLADPQALLMDEPFGAVDAQTKRLLQEELLRIWTEQRKLVLFVTHDIEEAVLLGDRVLVMSGRPGRIREDIPVPLGRPREPGGVDRGAVAGIRGRIWEMLEPDVRRSLWIPS